MKRKYYIPNHNDEIDEAIIKMIEQEADSKIFTLRILNEVEEGFELLIVFENKAILSGLLVLHTLNNRVSARLKMNYI